MIYNTHTHAHSHVPCAGYWHVAVLRAARAFGGTCCSLQHTHEDFYAALGSVWAALYSHAPGVLQCVTVCYSVLQCVVVCCSSDAECCSVLQLLAQFERHWHSRCVAACYSSVLQRVTECLRIHRRFITTTEKKSLKLQRARVTWHVLGRREVWCW